MAYIKNTSGMGTRQLEPKCIAITYKFIQSMRKLMPKLKQKSKMQERRTDIWKVKKSSMQTQAQRQQKDSFPSFYFHK